MVACWLLISSSAGGEYVRPVMEYFAMWRVGSLHFSLLLFSCLYNSLTHPLGQRT